MNCLCAGTRNAARKLTRYYEQELRPANMTPPQFELMQAISVCAGLTQCALAENLGLDQTTLSRNMQILLRRRWVKRDASSTDRRLAVYALASEGRKALDYAVPLWQRAQGHIRESLGEDWQLAWSVIERLSAAMYTD